MLQIWPFSSNFLFLTRDQNPLILTLLLTRTGWQLDPKVCAPLHPNNLDHYMDQEVCFTSNLDRHFKGGQTRGCTTSNWRTTSLQRTYWVQSHNDFFRHEIISKTHNSRGKHLTPASSICAQLWVPIGRWGQSTSLVSVPTHRTSSNKICPTPLAKPEVRVTAPLYGKQMDEVTSCSSDQKQMYYVMRY